MEPASTCGPALSGRPGAGAAGRVQRETCQHIVTSPCTRPALLVARGSDVGDLLLRGTAELHGALQSTDSGRVELSPGLVPACVAGRKLSRPGPPGPVKYASHTTTSMTLWARPIGRSPQGPRPSVISVPGCKELSTFSICGTGVSSEL